MAGSSPTTPEVRRHLDLCLDCRACESACPSGVKYGQLIEPYRIHQAKTQPPSIKLCALQKLALFRLTPVRSAACAGPSLRYG